MDFFFVVVVGSSDRLYKASVLWSGEQGVLGIQVECRVIQAHDRHHGQKDPRSEKHIPWLFRIKNDLVLTILHRALVSESVFSDLGFCT